jgi:hypothetical protein
MHAAIEPDFVDSGLPHDKTLVCHFFLQGAFYTSFTICIFYWSVYVCMCVHIMQWVYQIVSLSIEKCDAGLCNLYHSVF